jgi:hypothetical protein
VAAAFVSAAVVAGALALWSSPTDPPMGPWWSSAWRLFISAPC